MTFRASLLAADLAAAAHRAASVAKSPIVTVLGHALLRFERGQLLVAGTNMDQSIGMHVNADGRGVATVDAASLSAFAKRLKPKDQAHLDLTDGGLMAVVQGSARAELPYLPADDLPLDLAVSDGVAWDVPGALLADALARVSGAMAVETSRYYLSGVFVDLSGDVPHIVATNGGWMAAEPLTGVSAPEFSARHSKATIIPRDAIPQIVALAKDAETVTLTLSDFAVGACAGGVSFKTKLVEGSYPDWRRVVPRKSFATARVKREALLDAFGRAFAFDHGSATLAFSSGALEITGEAYGSFAKSNAAVAACETCALEAFDGAPAEEGFNSRMLSDIFASLQGADLIEFKLAGDGGAMIIRDPARSAKSVRVLMPLRRAARVAA